MRTAALRAAPALLCLGCLLAFAAPAAAAGPVWLCKPGVHANPCESSLTTTVLSTSGEPLGVRKVRRPRHRRVDCFYVYPTVSGQQTGNATLEKDPELRSIALYQAARYSQACRVFAPVYRQVTWAGVLGTAVGDFEIAYSDVRAAWRRYLRRYNHGRGVVLIGHSQGTIHLRRLISEEIDRNRSLRRRLVSALLLGWPVTVQKGRRRGGDFQKVSACRFRRQVGCVIAFSAFKPPVPANVFFGRAGAGHRAMCTNPSSLGGGNAALRSVFPTEPFATGSPFGGWINAVGFRIPPVSTPWVETVAYEGQCQETSGVNLLQVTGLPGAPTLHPSPDASWGLHMVDGNIALGNLVGLVRVQGRVHTRLRRFGR